MALPADTFSLHLGLGFTSVFIVKQLTKQNTPDENEN